MGQCLSQSSCASRPSDSGGRPCHKVQHVVNSNLTSPLPADEQRPQQAAKAEDKCLELYPFPSSASDGTSTQPSAAYFTTESSVARDTPSQVVKHCHADARQLAVERKLNSTGAPLPQSEQQFTSLAVPSACVSSSIASSGCRLANPQQDARAVKDRREDAAVNPDEIVVSQGGCCGPVKRKELKAMEGPDLSISTREAHDNGLSGLPHDLIRYGAPRPANEEARMATVRALRTMEMQDCPELDLILKVICRIYQAPAACVTLLDSDHVFICSAEGTMSPTHRPWSVAMCPWMLLGPNPSAMAVGDLAADARFAKSLHVAGGTRSYLTSPLVASNGHRLGAICFTDVKPRRFDAGDCRLMNNCAELAIRALESHLNVKERLGLSSPKHRGKPLARRLGSGSGTRAGGNDLDTDDGTLMEEYANRVRDVAEVDEAVVLLLDSRTPGWTILYVSPSWDELTGMDRAEVMGATLNEVMAHVNGDPRVVWEGVEREAAAGKAFVTPRVYCKVSPAVTFYLSFRPAGSDDLDDQTVTLGVPASVPQAVSAATSKLFFARLHTTPDPPANTAVQSAAASNILTTGRRLPPNIAINPVQGLTEMFQGLVVGQVLGQGSYGTVYHARWHGVDVAIKVQDMHIRNTEERARAEFEVGLGQRLHHVNVVHTLSHASALLERNHASGALDSNGSNVWNAGLQFAPLGFTVTSRASACAGACGRESTAPDSTENLAMGLVGAPAFIPFFLGNNDESAASSVHGDSAKDQPSLVDGPDPLTTDGGASNGGGEATGLQPISAAALAAAPPSSLTVASGPNALVCVALPSGAHVPMLRNPQRPGAAVGPAAAALAAAAAAAGGCVMPALNFARGSSRSGSPHCPGTATPSATAARTPAPTSHCNIGPAAAGIAKIGPSLIPRSGEESLVSEAAGRVTARASVTHLADNAMAATRVTAMSRANGSVGSCATADGDDADGAGGGAALTLVPFLTSSAMAAAGCSIAAEVDGVAPPVTHGGANGLSKGCFGSTFQYSSGTRGSAGCGAVVSTIQNLALDLALEGDGKKGPVHLLKNQLQQPGTGGQESGGEEGDRTFKAEDVQQPERQQSKELFRCEQARESTLRQQPQHSGTLALSGTYNGMPLLPYVDGGAGGFGIMNIISGATPRVAPGGGASGVECHNTATGVCTTMQGAIEADLSGLSYPLDVRLWMVLEFMDKGSLQDAIDRGWLREGRTTDHGPDYPAVLATAQDIAAAVAHLHSHDVVHGDLSAVNILLQSVRQQGDGSKRNDVPVDSSGRGFVAKVSDFGLSMQLKRTNEAVKTGAYGTITHMAPEVLRDSALSKPADVYSIGVLLWQMVTGSRPWAGLSHLQVSVEVGTNMRQLQWPSWVHSGVRLLGQRCLSPKPDERPTAAQMQAELAELMRQVPQYG
ncbi:hypothetical protein Vafri_15628 [Volvox africanus]|uniref:Protein kinase domain-containing protein n=1 Tax=Volvox africanus TaxID=51714 RepID=A0A8J4BLP7_9CHLO|nr:hypothetical protein Vafri_15628 [Volvox africanus]